MKCICKEIMIFVCIASVASKSAAQSENRITINFQCEISDGALEIYAWEGRHTGGNIDGLGLEPHFWSIHSIGGNNNANPSNTIFALSDYEGNCVSEIRGGSDRDYSTKLISSEMAFDLYSDYISSYVEILSGALCYEKTRSQLPIFIYPVSTGDNDVTKSVNPGCLADTRRRVIQDTVYLHIEYEDVNDGIPISKIDIFAVSQSGIVVDFSRIKPPTYDFQPLVDYLSSEGVTYFPQGD